MTHGNSTLNAVILGAGKDGSALLELFRRGSRVNVLGIADTNPKAPGLALAKSLGIPARTDPLALLASNNIDLIIDVSEDPALAPLILKHKPAGAQLLGGSLALLIWELTSQYEQDLREQLIQAEKLATIETLGSGIAHEINNPLYIITGYAEHLRDERRPEVVGEYVDAITESAHRIARIVRDVTAFARRRLPGEGSEIDINHTLDEAIRLARKGGADHELKVVTNYAEVPPVQGKPEEILQIYRNILTNAVQAMEGKGTLTVSTAHIGAYVHSIIRDSGPGIPAGNLSKIFDPFFTTKDPGKGTGLGLHLVREIVTQYGGYVTVESAVGHGAVFTVKLPAAPQSKSGEAH
jgi:two-component system, NtrC family, sensor kinase